MTRGSDSRRRIVFDKAGVGTEVSDVEPLPMASRAEITRNGLKSARVNDPSADELLSGILVELKIMNRHLAEITDEEITEDDLLGELT